MKSLLEISRRSGVAGCRDAAARFVRQFGEALGAVCRTWTRRQCCTSPQTQNPVGSLSAADPVGSDGDLWSMESAISWMIESVRSRCPCSRRRYMRLVRELLAGKKEPHATRTMGAEAVDNDDAGRGRWLVRKARARRI